MSLFEDPQSELSAEAIERLWTVGLSASIVEGKGAELATSDERITVYTKFLESRDVEKLVDVTYDEKEFKASSLAEEIEFQLMQENFPLLWDGVVIDDPKMLREIVIKLHIYLQAEEYQEGLAQLSGMVLASLKGNGELSFGILQSLLECTTIFNKQLRDECYCLVDKLIINLPNICKNFDICGFTVADLADILTKWSVPLFSVHFDKSMFIHIIDIILLDGCDNLMNFFYGLIYVFKTELSSISTQQVYQFMTDMPFRLKNNHEQIKQVFTIAYSHHSSKVQEHNKKDYNGKWEEMISHSGVLLFTSVGYNETEDDGHYYEEEDDEERHDENKSSSLLDSIILETKDNQNEHYLRQQLDEVMEKLASSNDEIMILKAGKLKESRKVEELEKQLNITSEGNYNNNDKKDDVNDNEGKDEGRKRKTEKSKQKSIIHIPKNGLIKYSQKSLYQVYPCRRMEGYMRKFRMSSSIFKNITGPLRTRYFVLEGRFLTYYKARRDTSPTKDLSVDINNREIVRVDNNQYGDYGLRINTYDGGILYLMFAPSLKERETWYKCLVAASKGMLV